MIWWIVGIVVVIMIVVWVVRAMGGVGSKLITFNVKAYFTWRASGQSHEDSIDHMIQSTSKFQKDGPLYYQEMRDAIDTSHKSEKDELRSLISMIYLGEMEG